MPSYNTVVQKVAKIISALSSPFLVIPLFGILIITSLAGTTTDTFLQASAFFTLILGLPFIYIVREVRSGRITDLHVAVREQRSGPFIAASIGSALLLITFALQHAQPELIAMAAALLITGMLFGVITMYWKISIHAASFAGCVTLAGILISPVFFWNLLFLPFIMWARIMRERHTIAQGIAAIPLAMLCIYGTLSILL